MNEQEMNKFVELLKQTVDNEGMMSMLSKLVFDAQQSGKHYGKIEERERIVKIIEKECWDNELCPYCTAPMKKSHYCEDCQDRVISGAGGHGIANHLTKKINETQTEGKA